MGAQLAPPHLEGAALSTHQTMISGYGISNKTFNLLSKNHTEPKFALRALA